MRKFIVLWMVVFCSGCGLQASQQSLPEQYQTLRLSPVNSFSVFHRALKKVFLNHQVALIDCPKQKIATLHIHDLSENNQVVGFSPTGENSRRRLHFTVSYTLQDENDKVLAEGKAQARRYVNIRSDSLLSDDIETETIQKNIDETLAKQVLRQLIHQLNNLSKHRENS